MTKLQNTISKLIKDEDGGELLEYALIAGLIALAAITAITVFSDALKNKFSDMGDAVGGGSSD